MTTATLNPSDVRTIRERDSFRDEEFARLAAASRDAHDRASGFALRGAAVPAELDAECRAAAAAVAAHPYSIACRAWYRRNGEEE